MGRRPGNLTFTMVFKGNPYETDPQRGDHNWRGDHSAEGGVVPDLSKTMKSPQRGDHSWRGGHSAEGGGVVLNLAKL